MSYAHPHDHTFNRQLRGGAKEAVDAFVAFDKAVFAEREGGLDVRTRELIAIGVAATTQCPYCMDAHTKAALAAGATESDVAEAVMVAAALRAGAAYTHGWLAMKLVDGHSSADS
ncbi:carboxymuconolactone decarboxylase family protein [Ornithinimicrobium cavernae]|uniref:carboxymuconolactone decarboxylase family protein n=1 Tax=Ornithinimicrobium cavernae TaxID=2666047 RepID=UPI000D69B439|nr:carboxymuconolactone decarboxylase family protein [Ornithinimicrobium cavernae]